jgi:hypothetical protein
MQKVKAILNTDVNAMHGTTAPKASPDDSGWTRIESARRPCAPVLALEHGTGSDHETGQVPHSVMCES